MKKLTYLLLLLFAEIASGGSLLTNYKRISVCNESINLSKTIDDNYNIITGKLLFDNDGNGLLDDVNDFQPFMKIKCTLSDGTILHTTTDNLATYSFYILDSYQGSYNVVPVLDLNDQTNNLFNLPIPGEGTIVGTNQQYIHNFILSAGIEVIHDYEVVVIPLSPASPGQEATYKVVYKNKGSNKIDAAVSFRADATKCVFASCSQPSVTTLFGYRSVSFTNLMPFESRSFIVTVTVNTSNAGSNPAIVGETMDFNTSISQFSGTNDPYLADNSFNYKQPIVASDNANRIECLQGNSLPTADIGKYLHYAINFENTANQTATNLLVKTNFDPLFYDLDSLQILDASHAFNLEIEEPLASNEEEFYKFNNISLGGPGGSGQILLKVKSNNTLPDGSTVGTGVEMFFEYATIDPQIVTVSTTATTYQNLNVSIKEYDNSIMVYPNPVSSDVIIDSDYLINAVQLFDIYGRLLQTNIKDENQSKIDMSNREDGIYFIKVKSEKGEKVEKVVKKQ